MIPTAPSLPPQPWRPNALTLRPSLCRQHARMGAGSFGRDASTNSEIEHQHRIGAVSGQRTDVASHTYSNDTRLAGYATEPSRRARRECGSAQGREKGLHSQKKRNAESPRLLTNGAPSRFATRPFNQSSRQCAIPRTSSTRGPKPQNQRHRGAMTATGPNSTMGSSSGRHRGPYSSCRGAPSLYRLPAPSPSWGRWESSRRWRSWSPPFWRRVCRRPVYLPYTALLRRHPSSPRTPRI